MLEASHSPASDSSSKFTVTSCRNVDRVAGTVCRNADRVAGPSSTNGGDVDDDAEAADDR